MATSLRPLYGCDFTAVGEGAGSVRETESFIAHGRVWEHCETAWSWAKKSGGICSHKVEASSSQREILTGLFIFGVESWFQTALSLTDVD